MWCIKWHGIKYELFFSVSNTIRRSNIAHMHPRRCVTTLARLQITSSVFTVSSVSSLQFHQSAALGWLHRLKDTLFIL